MKHEPIREEAMLDRCEYYTVCEVLREVYLEAKRIPSWPGKNEMMTRIRLASSMAKAVTKRLYKHEPNYLEELYDKTEDVKRESL